MWISSGELAKRESVSRITIQRWVKDGKYERVKRTKGGHYRVWIEQEEITILYARVSSSKQKSSIETQLEILKKEYPNGQELTDIASGFNFERRGFKSILERAIEGIPIHLVATTQDRICRTGFGLIKRIIELPGGRIELLEEDNSSEQFDTKTLVSFITSFVNSYYGKRSSRRRIRINNEQENSDLS